MEGDKYCRQQFSSWILQHFKSIPVEHCRIGMVITILYILFHLPL